MIEEKFLTACVVGHAGHGKTSLVRKLFGMNGRSVEEERQLGGPLVSGFSVLQLPSGCRVAFIEVPTYTHVIKLKTQGLYSVDLAIFVLAADDGVTPKTEEHLGIPDRLGARTGLVVISKADLVDQEILKLAEMEIREILNGSFLGGKQFVSFSAVDGRGLEELVAIVENEAQHVDKPEYFSTDHYKLWKAQLLELAKTILMLDVFKMSVSIDELRSRLEPRPDEWLLGRMLTDLCSAKKLIPIDGGYRIPTLSIKLPPDRKQVANQMLEHVRRLGYQGFSARTLCELHWKSFNEAEIRHLLEYLRSRQILVRLKDGRYLTQQAIRDIKERVRQVILEKGILTIQDGKEILGYGRTRAIPVSSIWIP